MYFSGLIKGRATWPDILIKLDEYGTGHALAEVMKVTESQRGGDTLFEVWADDPSNESELESAVHAWFRGDGKPAPFPPGTLLHFSYQAGERVVHTRPYSCIIAEDEENHTTYTREHGDTDQC